LHDALPISVTDVLRQLQDKGWIAAQPSSGGRGRPAQVFSRVVAEGLVGGLDLGAYEVAASVADLSGTVLARDRVTVHPDLPRAQRLTCAAELLEELLARAGHTTAQLWAVLAATTRPGTGAGTGGRAAG